MLLLKMNHHSPVFTIFKRTRITKKDSRILNCIPRHFKDRFRAIGHIEHMHRKELKYQTRIKMGVNDLDLQKKVRGQGNRWLKVALNGDLPAVDYT